jgi:hypothetical protein
MYGGEDFSDGFFLKNKKTLVFQQKSYYVLTILMIGRFRWVLISVLPTWEGFGPPFLFTPY